MDAGRGRRPDGGRHGTGPSDPGLSPDACTVQLGRPGPWHERLLHFRADVTPSVGDELQSEYFVARGDAPGAVRGRAIAARTAGALVLVSEVRSVAADEFWISPAYGRSQRGDPLHVAARPSHGPRLLRARGGPRPVRRPAALGEALDACRASSYGRGIRGSTMPWPCAAASIPTGCSATTSSTAPSRPRRSAVDRSMKHCGPDAETPGPQVLGVFHFYHGSRGTLDGIPCRCVAGDGRGSTSTLMSSDGPADSSRSVASS